MALALKNIKKVDMPLNKETKPNPINIYIHPLLTKSKNKHLKEKKKYTSVNDAPSYKLYK